MHSGFARDPAILGFRVWGTTGRQGLRADAFFFASGGLTGPNEESSFFAGCLAHHEALDVMLLRDGDKFLDDATDEVFAQLLRQAVVIILRDHQIMELVVTGSGGVDADDEYRARNG